MSINGGKPEAKGEATEPRYFDTGEIAIAEQVGPFLIGSEVGRGGMGIVYKGHDPKTGVDVAVKIVQNFQSESALKRFLREIRLLELVKSDFVSAFVAAGEYKGRRFLAMEYVPGKSLCERLQDGVLSEEETLSIAGDVARGVAEIHAAGIVHRDIKPANIILCDWNTPQAKAKLCDFGIAKRQGSVTDAVTNDGDFIGTPAFVAPEILMGKTGDVRADVYSLGALLFTMITGKAPFERQTVIATIAAQVHEPVPKLREKCPEASVDLADLVESCLARAPGERPLDARAVLEQIELIRRGERRLLSQHPLVPKEADEAPTRVVEIEVNLSSSPSALWPFVSDTNRVNRNIGLPLVEETRDANNEVVGVSKNWWGTSKWREHPYEWVAPQRLGVVRVFSKGMVNWYRSTIQMEATTSGTHLLQTVELAPTSGFISFFVGLEMRRHRKAFTKLYKRIDSVASSGAKPGFNAFVAKRLRLSQAMRLKAALKKLKVKEGDSPIVEALAEYIKNANAQDAACLRPKEWAKRYGFPVDRVIRTFLQAAKAGMLELGWHLRCPTCRVPSSMVSVLAEMSEEGHCESCEVSFGLDFARNVELIFTVNKLIRKTDTAIYCIGGPGNRPHIVAQVNIPPGERFSFDLNLDEGMYQVAGGGLEKSVRFSVSHDAVAERMELAISGRVRPEQGRLLHSGTQQIVCTNETNNEQLVRVEGINQDENVFSAVDALGLPLFRDLFEDQQLSSDAFVHSTATTILFVGLGKAASQQSASGKKTRSLDRYADFAKIRKIVEAEIAKENGMTVKIFGTSLMACFKSPGAALRAGMAAMANDAGLEMSAAVETGTAVVTTANRDLDLMGEVVDNAEAVYETLSKGQFGLGPEIARATATSIFIPENAVLMDVPSVAGAKKLKA